MSENIKSSKKPKTYFCLGCHYDYDHYEFASSEFCQDCVGKARTRKCKTCKGIYTCDRFGCYQ